jgi:anaerobic dimethyl sulfoxide reductase subunit C (anchor subunit)
VLVPIAAVIGLADVFVMASIYRFTSVQAWQSSSVLVEFYAAALSLGAVLFLALNRKEASPMRRTATLTTGAVVSLQVVSMILYYVQLGANESLAAQKSLSLLNSMGGAIVLKWLLILLGTGLMFFPLKKTTTNISAGQGAIEVAAAAEGTLGSNIFIAAALLIIGQLFGRYLFYAVMMISTVGLN